ncbi:MULTISPECIES: XisH family protein [Nostocales]|uniref:XisH family protein n=1 Tax=Nostocales TaxID=1161 RepID=UPI0004B21707|nr:MULTISPECIES: XisH family protein [Nostocales]
MITLPTCSIYPEIPTKRTPKLLEKIEPERLLYLAVRLPVYETFFQRKFIISAVEKYQLRLIIYDVEQEIISQWL